MSFQLFIVGVVEHKTSMLNLEKGTNIMKSLLIQTLLGLLLTASLRAGEVAYTVGTNVVQLFSTAAIIRSVTVAAGGALVNVNFYDNSHTNTTYVIGVYTNRTSYATNITSIITNTLGRIVTNIYVGQFTLDVATTATTNTLPAVTTFAVPANGTAAKLGLNATVAWGLTAKADVEGNTVIVNYDPL